MFSIIFKHLNNKTYIMILLLITDMLLVANSWFSQIERVRDLGTVLLKNLRKM